MVRHGRLQDIPFWHSWGVRGKVKSQRMLPESRHAVNQGDDSDTDRYLSEL